MLGSLTQPVTKKAIAYYRHSAEDKQENSVPIQREHAQKFAKEHDLEIIHEEADEGKSGLLSDRPGFNSLFENWILKEDAPTFDYILVYDVSRWGRFQDQDEAAYFEYRCKQRDKKVVYVSRGFPREEQKLITHLQTSIERYMAAEYSRQLSDKVFSGCVKVSQQGYSAGGTAPYGMARLLLDAQKNPKGILKRGEHKAIDNERVTFTPLNDQTTEAVKEIYKLLVEKWHTPQQIADVINKKGILSASGKPWNREKVIRILTNETYTGTRIYNKTWNRLKQGHRANPRSEWVFTPNAFPTIVEHDTFGQAQEHLYWLMVSKFKKGIYITRKVSNFFLKELKSLLEDKEWGELQIHQAVQNFPVVFALTFYSQSSTPYWCFVIPPEMRKYDWILAIGLTMDNNDNPVREYFFVPTQELMMEKVLLFGQSDKYYEQYRIKQEEVIGKIHLITEKITITNRKTAYI